MSDTATRILERDAATGDPEAERARWRELIRQGRWTNLLPTDAQVVASIMTAGAPTKNGEIVRLTKDGVVPSSAHRFESAEATIGIALAPWCGAEEGDRLIVISQGMVTARIHDYTLGDGVGLSVRTGFLTGMLPDERGTVIMHAGGLIELVNYDEEEAVQYGKVLLAIRGLTIV